MPPPEEHAENRPRDASPLNGQVPPPERRWKRGQSGNPGGRPKGLSVSAELRRLLDEDHQGKALTRVLAERWLKEALSGKPAHLQMLLDRTEGTACHFVKVEREPDLNPAVLMQIFLRAIPEELRMPAIEAIDKEIGELSERPGARYTPP